MRWLKVEENKKTLVYLPVEAFFIVGVYDYIGEPLKTSLRPNIQAIEGNILKVLINILPVSYMKNSDDFFIGVNSIDYSIFT